MVSSSGAVTARPSHRPYRDYLQQQRELLNKNEEPPGQKLVRQMIAGFVCAGLLGLALLILGGVFIGNAIKTRNSVIVMLCIMGLVFGLIILVGACILGKLFISRKWLNQEPRQPPQQCFHTCSVIYTPSVDQLATPAPQDPPPPYENIMMMEILPGACTEEGNRELVQASIALPPKYSDVTAPIPGYGDPI